MSRGQGCCYSSYDAQSLQQKIMQLKMLTVQGLRNPALAEKTLKVSAKVFHFGLPGDEQHIAQDKHAH